MSEKEKTCIIPYTITKLSKSLVDNDIPHELMPKIRQISLIHSPCVKEDSVVLVEMKSQDDSTIGYMGTFHEVLHKPNISVSWGICLFVDSQYRGKGYGSILNAEIMKYSQGTYMVINHVPATANILNKQGQEELWYDKYQLYVSRWNEYTGKHTAVKSVANSIHKSLFKKSFDYSNLLNSIEIEYTKCIDNETYRFINEHSENDMFLRSKEMLNWILQYPFTIEAPLINITNQKYQFSYSYKINALYAVKVYYKQELIGFFILKNRNSDLTLLYRYFNDTYRECLYATIAEHIIQLKPQIFTTTDISLTNFLEKKLKPYKVIHTKFRLSFPKHNKEIDVENGYIQGGDGDMFI